MTKVRGTERDKMGKKSRSEAMAAIHKTMDALHNAGAIDKQTMAGLTIPA